MLKFILCDMLGWHNVRRAIRVDRVITTGVCELCDKECLMGSQENWSLRRKTYV